MFSKKNFIRSALFFLVLLFSCNPRDEYIGIYDGIQYNHYYSITPGSNYSYNHPASFEVESAGSPASITVNGKEILIKADGTGSLKSDYGIYFTIKFIEDSAFVWEHSNKGHGGGSGTTSTIKAKRRID